MINFSTLSFLKYLWNKPNWEIDRFVREFIRVCLDLVETSTGYDYISSVNEKSEEVVFSGVTTLLALGSFFLLPMEAMRTFGIVLFIAIFYAIVGALVFSPLLLRMWGPKEVPGAEEKG